MKISWRGFGHEIGHVIARHGGERITQTELFEGLSGAATVATGDYATGQGVSALLNQFFLCLMGEIRNCNPMILE